MHHSLQKALHSSSVNAPSPPPLPLPHPPKVSISTSTASMDLHSLSVHLGSLAGHMIPSAQILSDTTSMNHSLPLTEQPSRIRCSTLSIHQRTMHHSPLCILHHLVVMFTHAGGMSSLARQSIRELLRHRQSNSLTYLSRRLTHTFLRVTPPLSTKL